ncbi:hypothetical protein [Candidatus Uabimicrobium amorphum]|uniref:Uncharacterized protein n=1 Tax=Uabimicrobium amorphum TaxID=2596890 RepID=A0A5S9F1V4_UABAM|nr:hypothetical protein [Candidatus Uabimicrobium amorphum]BBM82591.1 hypothetical protein UABAM_00934 [Candidatus Uabimicrobium amorphum]
MYTQNIKPYQLLDYSALHVEDIYEKVNLCCEHIENMIHFTGIVATALYRDYAKKNVAIDHAIFISFEKSFFGSWLYLTRRIGEFFYDENYTATHFIRWVDFLQKYGHDNDLVALSSDFLQFRNDVRHGSAAQNEQFATHIVQKIEFFHREYLSFLHEYDLGISVEDEKYQVNSAGELHPRTLGNQTTLCDQEVYLNLSPFVSWDQEDKILALHNAPKKKESFYDDFAIGDRYKEYLQQKDGISSTVQEQPNKHFSTPIFEQINSTIAEGKNKIVLWAPPGGGKTYVIRNLTFPVLCQYSIEDSPLKIRPSVALRTFYKKLCDHVQQACSVPKKQQQLIQHLCELAKQHPQQKFVIAIDGLFSIFVKEWWKEEWLTILGSDYPANIVWIVTACPGEPVPQFYDTSVDIPPINTQSFAEAFPQHDAQKVIAYTLGCAKFIWLCVTAGENSVLQKRYFGKWLRHYAPNEDQKRVLSFLAQTSQYLSAKEIAASLQIFTPKVERFLGEIDILMNEKNNGYTTYHPVLAAYLKDTYSN